MNVIKGDLIKLALAGQFDVIVHGCNCFCTMGAGIAKSIKETFPEAYAIDRETAQGDKSKLGTISYADVLRNGQRIIVVNAYTQFHWGSRFMQVDYDAVRASFEQIKRQFSGKRIAYPKIGAGLAGGDWAVISKIIDETLSGEQHCLVEYHPE